jgi:serine/threonine protein kinase
VQFGRYRLIDRLGQGGMADVYRAVVDGPRGFQRQLVIKRIHKLYAHELDFISMLGNEARVTAVLNHPSIVQVHEFGQVGDEFYLAMELAEGPDLGKVLTTAKQRDARMPAGVACYIVAQLADALAYAHTLTGADGVPLDIIHRDVTPTNVVVSLVGGVKLLDFGIAKAAAHLREDRTRTGAIKGKVAYLAPEQVDGALVDHRADQYSLGLVFHECLTGNRLWKGLVREGTITPPSQLVPGLDPDIDAVMLRMLARAPEERFPSCAEVAKALSPLARKHSGDSLALRDFLASIGPFPVTAEPLPPSNVSAQPAAGAGSVTGSVGEMRPDSSVSLRRPPAWRRLSVAVGTALAVLALVLFWPRPQPTPAPVVDTRAASHSPAPTPALAPAPAPVEPPRQKLKLEGPAGADVLVDGVLVGQAPIDLNLPRKPASRHLVVQMAGHAPWARDVAGDVDMVLTPPLLPLPAAPKADKKPHPAAKKAPVVRDPFAK